MFIYTSWSLETRVRKEVPEEVESLSARWGGSVCVCWYLVFLSYLSTRPLRVHAMSDSAFLFWSRSEEEASCPQVLYDGIMPLLYIQRDWGCCETLRDSFFLPVFRWRNLATGTPYLSIYRQQIGSVFPRCLSSLLRCSEDLRCCLARWVGLVKRKGERWDTSSRRFASSGWILHQCCLGFTSSARAFLRTSASDRQGGGRRDCFLQYQNGLFLLFFSLLKKHPSRLCFTSW